MNFLRTDDQVALNSLLVAALETLDHYRDAAELAETNLGQLFRNIDRQRRNFIHRLKEAVRASGNLPAVPDPDKEASEMLLHHVAALIKNSYDVDILEQRIKGEIKLADLIIEAQTIAPDAPHTTLLDEFAEHISDTITQLQSMHTKLIAQKE